MIFLNKSDFNNFKYLICSTGWIRNEDIVDFKDENSLLKRVEELLKCRGIVEISEGYLEDLIDECFYHLKCYNKLHLKGKCLRNYLYDDDDDDNWGNILPDEAILLLHLYQNLLPDDFFCLMENVYAITKEQYMNFQANSGVLNDEKYIPKIYQWLVDKNNPFADKVLKLMDRLGISKTQGISITQGISRTQGICLIINNENFFGYSKRYGTMVDEENIKNTFSELNFNILVYQNVPKDDLITILESTKSKINNQDRIFVSFFLSHGKKGTLITSDGKEIKFKDLWDPFRGSRCNILLTKPKLFFFVCCQGNDINLAISGDEIQVDSATLESDAIFDNSKYPDISNFFFGYATYKTFLSYRHLSNGTFYIEKLCKTIRENPTKSISEIHEIVNGLFQSTKIPGRNFFQMPYFKSLLGKPCYLVDNNNG